MNEAGSLAGEAKWVFVSALRAMKAYVVFGVNPRKVTLVCHVKPLSMLYWHPSMALSVMLMAVALSIVGAAGAV